MIDELEREIKDSTHYRNCFAAVALSTDRTSYDGFEQAIENLGTESLARGLICMSEILQEYEGIDIAGLMRHMTSQMEIRRMEFEERKAGFEATNVQPQTVAEFVHSRDGGVRAADVAKHFGISKNAANQQLFQANKRGQIARIAHGLYGPSEALQHCKGADA